MKIMPTEACAELVSFMQDLFKQIETPSNLPMPLNQVIDNMGMARYRVPIFQGLYLYDIFALSNLLTIQATFSYLWAIKETEITAKCAGIIQKYHLGEDDIQPEGQAQAL